MTREPSFDHRDRGTPAAHWRTAREALPTLDLEPGDLERAVVVAAHPDDESLGAAGLMVALHEAGVPVHVVCATAGEASHPASPTHGPADLARRRRAELAAALDVLVPGATHEVLGLPDGGLAAHEAALVSHVVRAVGDGRRTLLVATWRGDGHADHEAVGRAASVAAARTAARLVEYPVWLWHWGHPETVRTDRMRALPLAPPARDRKRRALDEHVSQVGRLSPYTGDEPIVSAAMREHHEQPEEVVVLEDVHDAALDELHAAHEDPWDVSTSWYERRKEALTLAVLPQERYGSVLDIGCSIGVLSQALAQRADRLVAVDSSPRAVQRARERLGASAEVLCLDLPDEWAPQWSAEGGFDLVVLSEVGYFMSPRALEETWQRVRESLRPGGTVLLAHWRHPIEGWPLDAAAVHESAAKALPEVVARYVDDDVEIVVHRDGPGSPR